MSGLRVWLKMSNCKRSYWVISIAKSILNLQHYHMHTMKKEEKKAWWKFFEKRERGNTDEKDQHLSDACHRQTHLELPPAFYVLRGNSW